MEDQANEGQPPEDVYNKSKASKFNFKSKSECRSKRQDREDEADSGKTEGHFKRSRSERGDDLRREHRTSRKKHKREHRHQTSRTTNHGPAFNRTGEYDNPDHRYRESIYDGIDDFEPAELNTEDAFRESLFDALADDEGAAYWEGVYGQPIHVYSNTKPGSDGKLERMNDEEYAEYVRTKMWEKSHQHILEEREAREKARRKQKDQHRHLEEEAAREEEEREKIRRQVQQTLKRGEERKKARELDAAWENYTKKWADLKNTHSLAQGAEESAHELIPWPVLSGKSKHVSKEEVEYFFNASKAWKEDATAMLKGERVRWHPDKMQQRFGQHIDQETMKLVTAVFQVVDRLWNEQR